jgi:hypothetical protein
LAPEQIIQCAAAFVAGSNRMIVSSGIESGFNCQRAREALLMSRMIKVLFLIFDPEAAWNRIALSRRGIGFIFTSLARFNENIRQIC